MSVIYVQLGDFGHCTGLYDSRIIPSTKCCWQHRGPMQEGHATEMVVPREPAIICTGAVIAGTVIAIKVLAPITLKINAICLLY